MERSGETVTMSSRDYRLGLLNDHGTNPHAFRKALEKKWGIHVCAECGKARFYFAHDADLR